MAQHVSRSPAVSLCPAPRSTRCDDSPHAHQSSDWSYVVPDAGWASVFSFFLLTPLAAHSRRFLILICLFASCCCQTQRPPSCVPFADGFQNAALLNRGAAAVNRVSLCENELTKPRNPRSPKPHLMVSLFKNLCGLMLTATTAVDYQVDHTVD